MRHSIVLPIMWFIVSDDVVMRLCELKDRERNDR